MNPIFPALAPSGRLRRPIERIIVVQAGPNPSVDYYLRPRLAIGSVPFRICDIGEANRFGDDAPWSGTLILFCRYLSGEWLALVERHRAVLAGVAMFVDDDIDALAADWTVPLWYRLRLILRHLRYRSDVRRHLDLLLVSNPRIVDRHHGASFAQLGPIAGQADFPSATLRDGPFRVAFHATSVHRREHVWLREVLRRVLDRQSDLQVEIVATPAMSLLWRGLSCIRTVAPAPWSEFRESTRAMGADLLLAPLLPSPANAARAPTKRIDALRLGAAILVNEASIYRPTADEAKLGMCVELERALWVEAIVQLARDPERLSQLRQLNRTRVEQWTAAARPLESVISTMATQSP